MINKNLNNKSTSPKKLNLNEVRELVRKIIKEEGKNIMWTSDIEDDFNEWKDDDNVIKRPDGTYSTQDANWKNRLNDLDVLKIYYYRSFVG